MSGIDFIPEMILGIFGLFDDLFVVIWCLGIINEEIEFNTEINNLSLSNSNIKITCVLNLHLTHTINSF